MMEAARTYETSIYLYETKGLSQKADIFMLSAVRTWNLTLNAVAGIELKSGVLACHIR
jgi:hypothetical protein